MNKKIILLIGATLLLILIIGCTQPPIDCGNGVCDAEENGEKCPEDCGIVVQAWCEEERCYLESELIRVGINLDGGGIIRFLSYNEGANMINEQDYGREIQLSIRDNNAEHVSGEQSWNPTQGGSYNTGSGVIDYSTENNILYSKTQPLHWLGAKPADMFIEQWISFENYELIKVKYKVEYFDENTRFGCHEVPAVYLNEEFDNAVYYEGSEPFTEDLLNIVSIEPFGRYNNLSIFNLEERWGSLVDESGNGVTIYSEEEYTGGIHYIHFKNAPDTVNFMVPKKCSLLEPGTTLEFTYYIIPGHYENAREIIYGLNNID